MVRDEVLSVLRQIRAYVEQGEPSVYGTWLSTAEAVAAVDELLEAVSSGAQVDWRLRMLVAPTGTLQDHSLDNGWGDEFVELASRLDRALAAD